MTTTPLSNWEVLQRALERSHRDSAALHAKPNPCESDQPLSEVQVDGKPKTSNRRYRKTVAKGQP